MKKQVSSAKVFNRERCPSCGQRTMRKYCSECGEKAFDPRDLTTAAVLGRFFGGLFNFDSKFWRTLFLIALKPGQLSKDAVRGRRAPYMRPVQVFLFCNLVYFLFQPLTGANALKNDFESHLYRQKYSAWAQEQVEQRIEELSLHTSRTPEQLREGLKVRFELRMETVSRGLIIFLAPFSAVVLCVLCLGRVGSWPIQLHFALEFISWLMAYCLVAWFLIVKLILYDFGLAEVLFPTVDQEILVTILGLQIPVFLWMLLGIRRFSGYGWMGATIRAAMFTWLILVPIVAFRMLSFFVALKTV